ncbi:MAG: STAS domain-containing protein [Crocinitomicaceae bacterium]|nr:STAS domain-containing protein [Crocinitomicaceae bacterium]
MKQPVLVFEHRDGVSILIFSGKLMNNSLKEDAMEYVQSEIQNGNKKFIIDLSLVDILNSAGLNTLIRVFTITRNKGGEIVFVNEPSEVVTQLLTISKLNNIFEIYTSTEEAINKLNAQEA